MKRILYLLTIAIVLILSFISCKKKEQTIIQTSWSAKDPVAIPINTRLNQQNLGNLVPNASFEIGKVLFHESNIQTFAIDGWKVIGDHVEWVNNQSVEYESQEVFHGNHSVKVVKDYIDETETEGVGVLSDFIKVIPGNYFLKMNLRFKNIQSHKERLGFKLYDAVNIRLKYYDKNKIELSAQECNPFDKSRIDNGYKSLSISNFWEIENLDWCEVHGKSAYYPFFNGDIPDKARYVKIFIGLNGTGTLWIDKVDYRYTDENFTLLEKLEPYFNSSSLNNELDFTINTSADSINNIDISIVVNSAISNEDIEFLFQNGIDKIYFRLDNDLRNQIPKLKQLSIQLDASDKNYKNLLKNIRKRDFQKVESVLIKNLNDLTDLQDLINTIKRKKSDIEIVYLPKYNNLNSINLSKGLADNYFKDLAIKTDQQLKLVWTGENIYSNSIDHLNILQAQQTMQSNPIFLDHNITRSKNQLSDSLIWEYYPGKIRVLSLFEPYLLNNAYFETDINTEEILIGIESLTEFSKIQLLTAIDNYRYKKTYIANKSLWMILNHLYGREVAISLLKINDSIFGIKEMMQKILNNGLNNKDERIINVYITSMNKEFEHLQMLNPNNNILSEIQRVKLEVMEEHNKLISELNNLKK